MAKHTGPLLGYNNNVPYKGHVYHVQTEDSGSRRPHVITHLFADGGRIVKTRKTSYAHFVASENLTERVRALMRTQHKQMVITLRTGDFDYLISPAEGSDPRVLAKDMVETGELPPDAPLDLAQQGGDEREFQREMEDLAAAVEAAAEARAVEAAEVEAAAADVSAAPADPATEPAAVKVAEAEPAAMDTPAPATAAPPTVKTATPPHAAPTPARVAGDDEEKETTYKFVGRPSGPPKRRSAPASSSGPPRRSPPPFQSSHPERTNPPGRSSPPPARGRGGALPIKKRAKLDSQDIVSGPFGARFLTGRRLDEAVIDFFGET